MNSNQYFEKIKAYYNIVRVLSNKNDSVVLLLKHKTMNRYLVYKKFNYYGAIYDYLKGLSFENLPVVYDAIRLEDAQIVLEEYINGVTLGDNLENALYSYKEAKKVIYDLCDALSLLHSYGFVHRDIKPENVMIAPDGVTKLIDFNAVRQCSVYSQKDTIQMGTIGYASPEQLGLSQSDIRTDIYALGVLLNVMLTGKHPTKQLAKGKAGKVVLKCTQIDPESRFQTVEKLKAAL